MLAQNQRRLDAKTISEMTGVTLRFSLKILRKLVAAGIIKSFKGTQGGYEIGRELDHISLGEVIETIEGRYTPQPLRDRGICLHPQARTVLQVSENLPRGLGGCARKIVLL